MHHLLVHTPAARVALARSHVKVLVLELAPHAEHFHLLCPVRFEQEVVFHDITVS
jgi:hypothetical protein